MSPVVSKESKLFLLVLLLPFGHLVELVLGLPKDIVEISIGEIALQGRERKDRSALAFAEPGTPPQLHPPSPHCASADL